MKNRKTEKPIPFLKQLYRPRGFGRFFRFGGFSGGAVFQRRPRRSPVLCVWQFLCRKEERSHALFPAAPYRHPHSGSVDCVLQSQLGTVDPEGGSDSLRLTWSFIKTVSDSVEIGLAVDRQVRSFRKILAQQPVGVLVRPTLPRGLEGSQKYTFTSVASAIARARAAC